MNLTAAQQAAVVLAQLDDDRVHTVLSQLPERDVVRLMTEVARLPALAADEVRQIVHSFTEETQGVRQVRQGGIDRAHELLRGRLGANRAARVLAELECSALPAPFDFLDHLPPHQIAAFLVEEHPQTVALLLAHMTSDRAAAVLDALGHEGSADVVRRMATLAHTSPTVLNVVAEAVRSRLFDTLGTMVDAAGSSGVATVAGVLTNVDRSVEKKIFSRLEVSDPELAESIRSQMFVFEDVANLDDRTLQEVLREVAPRDLALALKGADSSVRDKFTRNLSERVAADVEEEIAALGPQRLSSIEAAQGALVKAVHGLVQAGTITLGRPDDELIA